MKTVETQIDIEAPSERVWQILTQDLPTAPEAYGIQKFEGQIKAGAKIKIWSEVVPDRAFALRVKTLDAPRLMVWQGGMPFGLFTGTRSFRVTSVGAGCRFEMKELFTGLFSGMITKSMPDLTPSFTKFAQTLKEKAEQK